MSETWDFSDEALVRELHRAIALLRQEREEVQRLQAVIERMRRQHFRFVHHFGKSLDPEVERIFRENLWDLYE